MMYSIAINLGRVGVDEPSPHASKTRNQENHAKRVAYNQQAAKRGRSNPSTHPRDMGLGNHQRCRKPSHPLHQSALNYLQMLSVAPGQAHNLQERL